MSQGQVWLRHAQASDAPFLAIAWRSSLRGVETAVGDIEAIIARSGESADESLLVAEYNGELAGAVLLRATTVSPINLEPTLHVIAPYVADRHRRKGVGRALLTAATSFAEERRIATIATITTAGSREANRYLARLGLVPHALMRTAPAALVSSRLGVAAGQRPPRPRQGARLSDVMAARRAARGTASAR